MFFGLIAIAAVLTLISLKANLILFRLSASASWLALGTWTLLGGSLSIGDVWTQMLGFVFLMMTIAPLTLQMVTDVKYEKGGKSWSRWERSPVEEKESRSSRTQREWRETLRSLRKGTHK